MKVQREKTSRLRAGQLPHSLAPGRCPQPRYQGRTQRSLLLSFTPVLTPVPPPFSPARASGLPRPCTRLSGRDFTLVAADTQDKQGFCEALAVRLAAWRPDLIVYHEN